MPPGSEAAEFIREGARLLSQDEIHKRFVGNTLSGEKMQWYIYHQSDGIRIISKNGEKIQRKWWQDNAGRFCIQSAETADQINCDQRYYEKGNLYKAFNEDGSTLVSFRILPGNPKALK